ncbi:hypothetical protein EDI_113910 [Entamoeba dispar SAW760]|uniref:Uncharacterized protein n=1 Tax=Entamoeba dispar (strain ATCC PRA-260 / SAW760) TaxID=370354 RepID=B0EEV8_ENTDS|nr:uncharacterized protein EDI_113910 [Entamoeba dispar SAW760]EDR26934.1 hypothetical protein EDI_113910 [Entamoeba dispar SAW760]|eukprot:EDR26934.1 hypothetical protein EDI_113910 [Entamoeba dispar SAW760]
MRSAANSTNGRDAMKPRKNVDVVKRSSQQELTATIPVSDSWEGKIDITGVTGIGNDVHTIGSLGLLSKSLVFRELCDCFDQFKIMDVHICGDVTKGVSANVSFNTVWNTNYAYRVSTDNGVNYTSYTYNDFIKLITTGDLTEAEQSNNLLTYLNTNYSYGKAINKPSNEQGSIVTQEITFPCIYGMAARRTIPNGFYQNVIGSNTYYSEPSYDEFSSYSSYIYQSKMPGAPMHLSLDIQGVSSSEKMMTIPTIMSGKLYEFKPELQNGRFIPCVLYGAKAQLPGMTGDENNRMLSVVQYFDENQSEWNTASSVKQTNTVVLEKGAEPTEQAPNDLYAILKEGVKIEITEIRGTRLDFIDNNQWTAYLNQVSTNASLTINDSYILKVMGYITVRFKQLRTTKNEIVESFSFLHWYISDGSSVLNEMIPLTGKGHYENDYMYFDIYIRKPNENWNNAITNASYSNNDYVYAILMGSVSNALRIYSYGVASDSSDFDMNNFFDDVIGTTYENNYSIAVGVKYKNSVISNSGKFTMNGGGLNIGRSTSDDYIAAVFTNNNTSISSTYVSKVDSLSGKTVPLLYVN